ncbi:hypothetical protein S245_056192, partial [Arachis hypogaea]
MYRSMRDDLGRQGRISSSHHRNQSFEEHDDGCVEEVNDVNNNNNHNQNYHPCSQSIGKESDSLRIQNQRTVPYPYSFYDYAYSTQQQQHQPPHSTVFPMLPPLLGNFLQGPPLPSSFAPSCAISNLPKN